MQIITSDRILNDPRFNYEGSELSLTTSERKVIEEHCVGISYLFADQSEFAFKHFVQYFLAAHLGEGAGGMRLVFSNRFIEPQSRVRSHQKLFYKEHELLGKEHFTELELDLPEGRSIFLGLVEVTAGNLPHVLERIFTSIFTFGLVAGPLSNGPDFLTRVQHDFLTLSGMRHFNPLKAFVGLREESGMLFQLTLHGNDDQSLDVLASRAWAGRCLGLGKAYLEEEERVVYN